MEERGMKANVRMLQYDKGLISNCWLYRWKGPLAKESRQPREAGKGKGWFIP